MLSVEDALVGRVADIIARYSIASAGDCLGVAVSGGADSIVLLHILHRLSAAFRFELCLIHINHRLRGSESDQDEAFVTCSAQSLGLELITTAAPIDAEQGNLEQAARDARRGVYLSLVRSGKVKRVALGHTESDQAETVLLRLFRGTGLAGLAGMRVVSPEGMVVRPLLTTSRDEVRSWAAQHGLTWREDRSNDDMRFQRNLIRKEILPAISAHVNSRVEHVLARTAQLAQSEEGFWAEMIEREFAAFAKRTCHGWIGDVRFLRGRHVAVQRRLLRRLFREVKGDLRSLESEHVEAALALCRSEEGHDRVVLPGLDVLRSFSKVRISPPVDSEGQKRHYSVRLLLDSKTALPFSAGSINLELGAKQVPAEGFKCAKFENIQVIAETATLDYEVMGGLSALDELIVRNWEPGDCYVRAGHQTSKKIKELFQESRVLLWERRNWPVLEWRNEIVWARGFGAAAKFAAEGDSRSTVSLTYESCP
jgi:tRNA(Ile)-lysidine synthase